jgi:hypothetical protein
VTLDVHAAFGAATLLSIDAASGDLRPVGEFPSDGILP